MYINVDKMIDKQKQENERIANLPVETVEADGFYAYEKPTHTKTHIVEHDNSIVLTRYMYNNIYRVVFPCDVKVIDIIDYMDVDDTMFIKCSERRV